MTAPSHCRQCDPSFLDCWNGKGRCRHPEQSLREIRFYRASANAAATAHDAVQRAVEAHAPQPQILLWRAAAALAETALDWQAAQDFDPPAIGELVSALLTPKKGAQSP